MTLERENIRLMTGYSWGEQPDGTEVIKLNTNENPYPPSPLLEHLLARYSTKKLRVYPSPMANELRDSLARLHQMHRDNFLITNGGDELLRLVFTTFLEPGEAFGMANPSYSLYPVLAKINSSPLVCIELEEDWSLPRDFSNQLNNKGVKLLCLTCPHAPSGSLVNSDVLGRVISEFQGVVLIDEAYIDFVDPALRYDSTKLVNAFSNVIILRSLSKGYSLAGMRVGYAIASKSLIAPMLTKTRDSYNVNALSQLLAIGAVQDQKYAEKTWEKIRHSRRKLKKELNDRGYSSPPSQANFLLVEVPENLDTTGAEMVNALRRHNILVRHFDLPRLEDKLRITVGTKEQNTALLSALDSIKESKNKA